MREVIGVILCICILALGGCKLWKMKRSAHFNFFYKAEVEKLLEPLEKRIKVLEALTAQYQATV